MSFDIIRRAVVAEAIEWLGTPYRDEARVKGKNGGCDCLTFVAGVYANAGVIDPLPIPHYAPQWHLHQKDEYYLLGKDDCPGLLHFCEQVPGPPDRIPLPADLVIYKFGNCYSHAVIVLEWPTVIHAFFNAAVQYEDADRSPWLTLTQEVAGHRKDPRERLYLRVKGW